MSRARLSLAGLSVGDALGERFFGRDSVVERAIVERAPPASTQVQRKGWGVFVDDELRSPAQLRRDPLEIEAARTHRSRLGTPPRPRTR